MEMDYSRVYEKLKDERLKKKLAWQAVPHAPSPFSIRKSRYSCTYLKPLISIDRRKTVAAQLI